MRGKMGGNSLSLRLGCEGLWGRCRSGVGVVGEVWGWCRGVCKGGLHTCGCLKGQVGV